MQSVVVVVKATNMRGSQVACRSSNSDHRERDKVARNNNVFPTTSKASKNRLLRRRSKSLKTASLNDVKTDEDDIRRRLDTEEAKERLEVIGRSNLSSPTHLPSFYCFSPRRETVIRLWNIFCLSSLLILSTGGALVAAVDDDEGGGGGGERDDLLLFNGKKTTFFSILR